MEREVLQTVLDERRPMVLATGGGIVTAPETYALLRQSALTVWLRATPEDHWNRVVRQGDRRPMADHPQAMSDLRYRSWPRASRSTQPPPQTVDTTGKPVERIVEEIVGVARAYVEAERQP